MIEPIHSVSLKFTQQCGKSNGIRRSQFKPGAIQGRLGEAPIRGGSSPLIQGTRGRPTRAARGEEDGPPLFKPVGLEKGKRSWFGIGYKPDATNFSRDPLHTVNRIKDA